MITLHNSQRVQKRYKQTLPSNRRERPHAYYKNYTYLVIPRMMQKCGYDYVNGGQVMMQLKESFQSKCEKYFSGITTNKMGRRDKHERKEMIGFQMKENPISKIFVKYNQKTVKITLKDVFQAIKSYQ